MNLASDKLRVRQNLTNFADALYNVPESDRLRMQAALLGMVLTGEVVPDGLGYWKVKNERRLSPSDT